MQRLTLAACVLLFACHDAAAQGFISPSVGTTLSTASSGSHSKAGYGLAFGSISRIVGVESEFAYYPEILDNTATGLAKNKAFTISGNTLVGPMIHHIKVYGAFGFGDLHLNVTSLSSIVVPNPEALSSDYFTFDVGGGVIGFLAPHLGVRGDVRYYKAFGFKTSDAEESGLTLDRFDFWRAGVGVVGSF